MGVGVGGLGGEPEHVAGPALKSLVFLRSLENIPLKRVHRSGYLRWPNMQTLVLGKHLKIHRYVCKPQTSGSETKRVHQYFPPNRCRCLTDWTNSSPGAPSLSLLPSPVHPPVTTPILLQLDVWALLHNRYSGALLLTLYLHEKHTEHQPGPVCRVSMNRISHGAAATELSSIWHCAGIYYGIKRAKLSCCFVSNPVTLRLEASLFPTGPSPSLSMEVPPTHTHTHSPRPKTWNFYKEQDTWELAKSHGATSINPPRLLLFSKADQEARGPGWATSCPREKSTVKSVSPLILRHPAQTLHLKPHFPTNHLYTVLFLLTLSKNSVWLPSHCDSLFRIEDSPPPFHLCSKGPLQTLSKPPQPPQAQVIRHWNKWWYFHGIFECNRPFSPDWKKEACGAVAGYYWAKVERQNP